MIGNIVQYLLYILLAVTVATAVGGVLLCVYARKGRNVNVELPLTILSIMASTTPYIGLFGTVWHIIQALTGIGTGNLNVSAIAQPIGAALFTTLWGLGCAIPALVSHRFMLYLLPIDDEVEATQ